MAFRCCVCGETDDRDFAVNKIPFHGRSLDVCDNCCQAFRWAESKSKKEKGTQYLRQKLENGSASAQGILLIKDRLHEEPTQEEIKAFGIVDAGIVDETEPTAKESSVPANSGDMVSLIAGVLFLIAAVVLYFVSIDNDYGVANIQSTTYSAANFVAAIVCFAASRIIRAINSK